jgi:peptidoglycan/LPS O-acetylase OafA/YrhL
MRYSLLEPLRGMAALWVFCSHVHFSEPFQSTFPELHSLLKAGALGVPMFFVLSGYCITASAKSVLRQNQSTASFLYRRLRRIFPPYWFSIVVVVSIPFIIESLSYLKTGNYTPPSANNMNYGFLNYDIVDWILTGTLFQVFAVVPGATNLQAKFTTINAVYWTLAIEVQFYLAVTLAIYFRRFYSTLLLITLISVPFFILPGMLSTGVFLPFWPMFAIGVLLYRVFEKGLSPSCCFHKSLLPVAWIISVCLPVAFILYTLAGRPISVLAFAGGFGLFLYFAESADRIFVEYALTSKRILIQALAWTSMAVGAMSYSLYLLHGRLQFLTLQAVRQVLPTNTIGCDFSVIVITSALCYVFYILCERRFMSSQLRKLSETPIPSEVDPKKLDSMIGCELRGGSIESGASG